MSSAAPSSLRPEWDVWQRRALMVGVGGLVVLGLVGLFDPTQLFRSYLVGFTFWLGLPLGSLVLLMVQHLTGGAWGLLLRRVLESGTRTLLLFVGLFIPLALGLHYLYSWIDHPFPDHGHEHFKSVYLSPTFFLGRAVFYFATWLAVAYFLTRWSAEQDQTGQPRPRRFRMLSGPGLALYGLTITFASIDWVMSLEPHWFSTIYPVMFAVGQVLSALAFALAVFLILAPHQPLAPLVTKPRLRDLGNLLLAFVMLWAYMNFSQYLLIWSGNIKEEIPWYLRRMRGGWEWVAGVLLVFQFALPFVLLLMRHVKDHPRYLAAVALGILAMRGLDVIWLIEPAFVREGGVSYWFWLLDLAALIGVGGLWAALFIGRLKRMPLLPLRDPYLEEALAHE